LPFRATVSDVPCAMLSMCAFALTLARRRALRSERPMVS
jgi:hypothetical protein